MLINFHQPKKIKNIDKTQVVLQQNIVHTVLASKMNRIFDHTALTATAGSEKLTTQTEHIPALYRC